MVGKCLTHLFVGLDVVLGAVQPFVLLPQWPNPSAGLRFTLPEGLGVHPQASPIYLHNMPVGREVLLALTKKNKLTWSD